jgi:hypothetical protein
MARNLTWIDFFILVAIALLAALNLLIYFGVSDNSARAVGPAAVAGLPDGNAPSVNERRNAAEDAENDDSNELPGRFVPTQGRSHVSEGSAVPFCEGEVDDECYASNPPTSGLHLGVSRNVRLESGHVVNIPPDPGIYSFEIPRESIPHLQEHAGVFLGYNCVSDACAATVERLERLVDEELSLGARVVMAPSSDLPEDGMALASWTRIDDFTALGYSDERVRAFIKAHSCRFDPEGFCDETPVN